MQGVKRVNENAKSFLCERAIFFFFFLSIESKETNNNLETLDQRKQSSLETLNERK